MPYRMLFVSMSRLLMQGSAYLKLRRVEVGAWFTSQDCLLLMLIMLTIPVCRPSGTRQTRSLQSLALESPPL